MTLATVKIETCSAPAALSMAATLRIAPADPGVVNHDNVGWYRSIRIDRPDIGAKGARTGLPFETNRYFLVGGCTNAGNEFA